MKEKLTQTMEQTSLSLGLNKIQAVRRKVSTRTACRVYNDERIGIAGAMGACDEAELYAQAQKNLDYGISYPVEPSAGRSYHINLDECAITDEELYQATEAILAHVEATHKGFTVNHKANLTSYGISLENAGGLKLSHRDRFLTLSLLLKKRGSSDILDTAFSYMGRKLEVPAVNAAIDEIITAFETPVPSVDASLPIVLNDSVLMGIFARDLSGKLFGNKASLFQHQLGQQVFSEAFDLRISTDPKECFGPLFDMEGTLVDESLAWLVREGRIIRPYTDKRVSKEFGYDNTGCAGGTYDGVPTLTPPSLEVVSTGKTLKTLLNGQKGILVVMAGGGDFTPDGTYASPVQLAYLTDGERLLGKMPQFTIKGSIFDILGKDYVGMSSNKIFTMGDQRLLVTKMETQAL